MDTASELPFISELIAKAWGERPETFTWAADVYDLHTEEPTEAMHVSVSVAFGRAAVIRASFDGNAFELLSVDYGDLANVETGSLGEIDEDMADHAREFAADQLLDARLEAGQSMREEADRIATGGAFY